ncbi:MAG TPA: hypothetical protein VE861_04000 [Gemmatimonadaceae bacterium]|nr:hypothetical protein [Gemmatimonadaceae bacterium]
MSFYSLLQDAASSTPAALPFFRTQLFYKSLHIFGLFLATTSLGGIAIHAANGGTRSTSRTRALTAGVFGLGMLLALAGGFGQAARLGMTKTAYFPGWLWAKIAIWIIVAVLSILPYRIAALAKPVYLLVPILTGLAAYLAIFHGL